MARPLCIALSGHLYHVTSRGNVAKTSISVAMIATITRTDGENESRNQIYRALLLSLAAAFVRDIHIEDLRVGDARVSLTIARYRKAVGVHVVDKEGEV